MAENKKRMLAIRTPKFDLESRKNLIIVKETSTDIVMYIWGKVSKTFLFSNNDFQDWAKEYFRDEFLGITNYHQL